MSRNAAAACGTTASVVTGAVTACAGQGTSGVAGVLRDKDSIIRAQAKHIGQLEREAERVRKERDSLATKVALLTYKLQMYSKDLQQQQHGRQTMNFTERKQTSDSTSRRLESSSSSSSSSYSSGRNPAAPTSRQQQQQQPPGGHCPGRPLPPPSSSQPKTGASAARSSPSEKLLQPRSHHHRVQKRTSDEDEKIKRSRDWDYELSQDLQAKQIEMLEKKYGGALRARRAARIIQQAYRQYCLNKNFAKLRLEADSRRLSRRFTDFGRSKTLWTDMVMTTMEYGGATTTPPVQHPAASGSAAAASFSNPVYGNSGTDVRPEDAGCGRVITHSSAAFSNYYCKVLQKSLTMSVSSASEHTTVVAPREAPQPPVRHTPTSADLGMIREMGHHHDSGGFRSSGELERSRSDQRRQQTSNAESGQRIASQSRLLENEADLSVWLVEKTEPACGGFNNGNDDDVAMAMGAMSSYVDHNSIDNNLDFDIEGNASEEPPYLGYADHLPMLSESPYCEQHKCIPLGMAMGQQQSGPHPGYYDDGGGGAIQVCRIPMSSMAPPLPPVQTSCSPSNHVYSSLRLCSLRHGGASPSVPAVESLASSRQPSTGSPVWKRKNVGDGFSYVYEAADPRGSSDHHPDLGGCGSSSALTAGMSAAAQVGGGIVAPQGAYMGRGGAPLAACTDCAQLLHHYHRHHHHHHHHHMLQQQAKVSDKQRKRTYRIGLNLFNKKPEKGIRYLIERRFLDNRPNAVARFLISRKGLSKQMIGEYLGNLQKQFNMEVLRCFADEIDLANLDVDVALRKFQSYFRMPGEAQKIERLMEAFASQYCQCNPNVVRTFRRADTVFLLAFATIMLNTDLHNKSIKAERRMKLTDFIRNLRGIDDGEDIDPNFLTGIYERMRVSEFQPGSDHVTQVAKVEASIVGKKPQLAALHRRLVCYCRLYEVQDLSRREKLGLHQREVFLFNDMLMVTKILGKKKNSVSYSFRSSFSLSGMGVYLFDTAHYKYGIRLVCSSSKKDYVMLYARNEHDRTKFVEDLKDAILEMNEMEALRIEEELQKQKVQQKHCNYNRHSKDSGVVDIEMLRPSDFAINRHSTADCVSVGRAPISGSLVDMTECGHHGSAGSLDSGLVSIHAQCDHMAG